MWDRFDGSLRPYADLNRSGWEINFKGSRDEKMGDLRVVSRFGIVGDFELSLNYKIIRAATPKAPRNGILLRLTGTTDDDLPIQVMFGHVRKIDGGFYYDVEAEIGEQNVLELSPTSSRGGELFLRRRGDVLEFSAGKRSVAFAKITGASGPLRRIQVVATNGNTDADLHVRVQSLNIEADSLTAGRMPEPATRRVWPYSLGLFVVIGLAAMIYKQRYSSA